MAEALTEAEGERVAKRVPVTLEEEEEDGDSRPVTLVEGLEVGLCVPEDDSEGVRDAVKDGDRDADAVAEGEADPH